MPYSANKEVSYDINIPSYKTSWDEVHLTPREENFVLSAYARLNKTPYQTLLKRLNNNDRDSFYLRGYILHFAMKDWIIDNMPSVRKRYIRLLCANANKLGSDVHDSDDPTALVEKYGDYECWTIGGLNWDDYQRYLAPHYRTLDEQCAEFKHGCLYCIKVVVITIALFLLAAIFGNVCDAVRASKKSSSAPAAQQP